MAFAAMMVLALLLDAAIGWPNWLFRRIGHPVTWLGAVISALEARWNRGANSRRFASGLGCVCVVLVLIILPAMLVQTMLPSGALGVVLGAVLAWPWVAARSLFEHVSRVEQPLSEGDLASAQTAVSMIVGRDPSALDTAGVARSAIESLAENASDGVVAPVFWGLVAGLPGLVTYKAVNTLDSMIGHRTERYEHFGKVAARLDDILNLVPARITGVFVALVSSRFLVSFRVMLADARHHRSPNAGWPEAAMAGALGVRLSGPRAYGERVTEEPWLNAGALDPGASEVRAALSIFVRALVLCGACLVVLAVV